MGELEKALEFIKKSIEINSEFADGWNSLGEYYEIKEDYKKALEHYQKAHSLDKENPEHKEAIERIRKNLKKK